MWQYLTDTSLSPLRASRTNTWEPLLYSGVDLLLYIAAHPWVGNYCLWICMERARMVVNLLVSRARNSPKWHPEGSRIISSILKPYMLAPVAYIEANQLVSVKFSTVSLVEVCLQPAVTIRWQCQTVSVQKQ